MKILAINGTYRTDGTTVRLTERALEGAASEGAETEQILLVEKQIRYCTNCLTCYRDLTSPIAPCPIKDDVREILEAIQAADGVILSSSVHCGLTSALMFAFLERAVFTLESPTGTLLGLQGCPEPRLTDKTRALATIVSAGGVPPELREYCDIATRVLGECGAGLVNGLPIAELYAAACFPRELTGADWSQAFLLRELTGEQLQAAYELGVKMARAIKTGQVRPYDPAYFVPAEDASDAS